MASTFQVTFPFFALVLLGYLAARTKLLPVGAVPGLNAYVLYFALPFLLFRIGTALPGGRLGRPSWLIIYLMAGVVIVFFTIATTFSSRTSLRDAAFGALASAFPNSAFMGVPLLVAMLGSAAAGPVVTTLLIDLVIISALCILVAGLHDRKHRGWGYTLGRVGRSVFFNPLPWAIGLGALVGRFALALPQPIDQLVALLAQSASPVALFTIGAVLWRSSRLAEGRALRSEVLSLAFIKLLLHPMLVLLMGALAYQRGAAITPYELKVLTLTAALPSASHIALLAERYYADTGRVARIILTSTLLAYVTVSLLAWALGR